MAATSRPTTQSRSRGTVLTDDDFLFVPPSTGDPTRSPRSRRRAPAPPTPRTIVGVGTCGIGPTKTRQPRDVHGEWLRDKREQSRQPGDDAGGTELPALTPREALAAEKKRKADMREARELKQEEMAMKCAEEKKARRAKAAAMRREAADFVLEYKRDMLEQRERDRRRARQWNQEMTSMAYSVDTSPRRLDSSRRRSRGNSNATATAGGGEGDGSLEKTVSPQRHKQEMMRVLRNEMKKEQEAWKEMTHSQRRVTREVVEEKHDRVMTARDSTRHARDAALSVRQEAAQKQREEELEYREKWSHEIEGWRSGLTESVQAERRELKKRGEEVRDHLSEAVAEEGQRLRDQWASEAELRKQRLAQVTEHNRAVADAVRSSLKSSDATRDRRAANRKLREEVRMESERLRGIRLADAEEERALRRELHEDIVRSRSTSPQATSPSRVPRPPASGTRPTSQ